MRHEDEEAQEDEARLNLAVIAIVKIPNEVGGIEGVGINGPVANNGQLRRSRIKSTIVKATSGIQ